MNFFKSFLTFILLTTSVAFSQEIEFPVKVEAPSPVETTESTGEDAPSPPVVTELPADVLYVITREDKDFFIVQGTLGIVNVTMEQGPIKIRGKFVDGDGKYETRVYNEKCVCIVEAVKKGVVELIALDSGAANADNEKRAVLNVMGMSPNPPPGPTPPTPPTPEPTPNPIPGDKNRVLIMYESSELSKLPASQAVQISSPTLRSYLNRKCLVGVDGVTPEYRIWDKDVDLSNTTQVWRDAMASAKKDPFKLPVLAVSNGKTGWVGTLPTTEAETLVILKRYLGE